MTPASGLNTPLTHPDYSIPLTFYTPCTTETIYSSQYLYHCDTLYSISTASLTLWHTLTIGLSDTLLQYLTQYLWPSDTMFKYLSLWQHSVPHPLYKSDTPWPWPQYDSETLCTMASIPYLHNELHVHSLHSNLMHPIYTFVIHSIPKPQFPTIYNHSVYIHLIYPVQSLYPCHTPCPSSSTAINNIFSPPDSPANFPQQEPDPSTIAIHIPAIDNPLSPNEQQELLALVNPLQESNSNGMDLFHIVVKFVRRCIRRRQT